MCSSISFDKCPAEYWSFFHITANASAGWYKGSFSTTTNNSTTGARQINIYGTTNTAFYIEQPIILLPATTYTLSFLYRDEGNSTSPLRFAFYSANSSSSMKIIQSVDTNSTLRWSQYDAGDKAYEFTFQCPSSTSSFSRCYVTFKTMSALPSSQIYFWLFSYAGSASSVRNTHIAELQLEQNSTYTTWTPDVRYNYSMITQKADNIKLAVSDGLKETGINIDTNKITLNASNTNINGDLNLKGTFLSENTTTKNKILVDSTNGGITMSGPTAVQEYNHNLPYNSSTPQGTVFNVGFTVDPDSLKRSGILEISDAYTSSANKNKYISLSTQEGIDIVSPYDWVKFTPTEAHYHWRTNTSTSWSNANYVRAGWENVIGKGYNITTYTTNNSTIAVEDDMAIGNMSRDYHIKLPSPVYNKQLVIFNKNMSGDLYVDAQSGKKIIGRGQNVTSAKVWPGESITLVYNIASNEWYIIGDAMTGHN